MNAAIHWSGLALILGAFALAVATASSSVRPIVGGPSPKASAALLMVAAALLLLGLPGMYAAQADATGLLGLGGHALHATGMLLLVAFAAPPLLDPSRGEASGESVLAFALGISLTLGLLLTGLATFQAGVLPRPAAAMILAATAGFFFVFFVAEFLPPVAGQIGSALFGIVLAIGLAWTGAVLWLRN